MTTTSQPFTVAIRSSVTYCDCSSFISSLTSILFNINNATYQWESSLMCQNIWSNIRIADTISSFSITSKGSSTDYQCEINVIDLSPMAFISTPVTV